MIKTLIKLKQYCSTHYSYLRFPIYLNDRIRFYSVCMTNISGDNLAIRTHYRYTSYGYNKEEKDVKILDNNNILIAKLIYPGKYTNKYLMNNKIKDKYEYVCCLLYMQNIINGAHEIK